MEKIFIFCLLCCVLCGCGRQSSPAEAPSKPVVTNLEDVVFFKVNGDAVTAAEVKSRVLLQAKIAELRRQPIKEGQFAEWANGMAMRLTPNLLAMRLWAGELDAKKVVPSAEDAASVLKHYNAATRSKAKTLEELASKFGPLADLFRRQADFDARFATYQRQYLPVRVSDLAVSVRLEGLSNQVEQVAEIDARAWSRAQEAHRRLKGGEAWEQVAPKYTEDGLVNAEHAEYWKEWEYFNPEDVWYRGVREALKGLKKGDFTAPFDSDEGLLIVKVVDIDDKIYTCVRMLFRMGEPVEIPEREQMVAQIKVEKMRKLQHDKLVELHDAAKIDYPLGTNFTYRIWPVEKKDGKGKMK